MAIVGHGVFADGFPSFEAFSVGQPQDVKPAGLRLDRRSRARSSLLTKAMADTYAQVLESSALDASEVASVFGSSLGECETMIGLLDQVWQNPDDLSPMGFAMSVHNAASGVVSIAGKNRAFTTSIASDFDTVAMALAEACGLLKTNAKAVIVTCGDEPTPADLVSPDDRWSLLTAAIALVREQDAPASAPRISDPFFGEPTVTGVDAEGGILRNPAIGLLDLIAAADAGQSGLVGLDRGRGRGYSVTLASGTAK